MTAVKIDKMRKQYEDSKRGGDLWTADAGETKLYVHPPCREEDTHELTEGLNYIPVGVHYGVGKNNAMVICLDPEANPILTHPYLRPFLKKRGIKLGGKCPTCKEIDAGSMSPEEVERSKLKQSYLWGVTPLAFRASMKDEWRQLSPKPSIALVGRTLYEGLVELYGEVGDISDPTGATLAKVTREGKALNTKYKVTADTETTKKPLSIKKDPKLSAALTKALAEGGDCDLFRVIANMIKPEADVRALLTGVKIDESDADDEDAEEREEDDEAEVDEAAGAEEDDEAELPPPKKKSKPAPVEDEDDEEEEAPAPKKKKAAVVEEDEDEDEGEEEEDEPAPKKKPKAAPVEEDDEEEEAPAPKKKAKPVVEEDEDDEEEEAPAPKKKPKGGAEELDDLDAELDRLSKKKKSA